MEWIFYAILLVGAVYGIVKALTEVPRDYVHNVKLRKRLEEWERILKERDLTFKKGMLPGRLWLAEFIAEAEHAQDYRDDYLRYKSHPARKSAEVVADIKREKRSITTQLKFLEYQLRSYEEYFPILAEYRDTILDETIPLTADAANTEQLEAADPTTKYLSKEEWDTLPNSQRNQLALDRYLNRSKTNWEIGRLYERYLGYLRESDGWSVTYHGALQGFEDLGRDLICKQGKHIEIIQAKCWSAAKTIHEKHVFQLYGTTLWYRTQNLSLKVTPVFVTTTDLSDVARLAAKELGVRVEKEDLRTDYPMIKCNINRSTGEKIYHLPFDQQYDRVKIDAPGECYVGSVESAEHLGFRRAWRHKGKAE